MDEAITKYNGGAAIPAGNVAFKADAVPQTFGINADFYVYKNGSWVITDYATMKMSLRRCIVRVYTPTGTGPYFAVFEPAYFGISATKVTETDAAKVAALDSLYREVALLKYRYNALVGFMNTLAARQLNSFEQQIYNQGLVTLQNLNNQISQIKGIELNYTASGAIGTPVILIIAIIAILSGVAAWTITAIATEREKTKRINESYDLSKWIAIKKQEIANQVQQGVLSQTEANSIYTTLDKAAETGNKIATQSSKESPGLFSDIATLAKWGVAGLIAYGAIQIIKQKRSNA
jgi:hypothetical protein